jgi:hypothetical protein
MLQTDDKGISQLLLSPLFLFNHILAVLLPGLLFLMLLSLKGNILLRNLWLIQQLGYKTKVGLFLLLAYVVGSVLRAGVTVLFSLRKKKAPPALLSFESQPPEVQKMLGKALTDGALLSTPGLMDRLSLSHTDAGFHLGAGLAFLIAASVPGDGSLRWLELLAGTGMFWAGILKSRSYQDEVLGMVGIGWANIFARITPQQATTLAAVYNALKTPQPTTTTAISSEPTKPTG